MSQEAVERTASQTFIDTFARWLRPYMDGHKIPKFLYPTSMETVFGNCWPSLDVTYGMLLAPKLDDKEGNRWLMRERRRLGLSDGIVVMCAFTYLGKPMGLENALILPWQMVGRADFRKSHEDIIREHRLFPAYMTQGERVQSAQLELVYAINTGHLLGHPDLVGPYALSDFPNLLRK